jgi:hypothetical protein
MKFWCGDYDTEEWVIGSPIEVVLLVALVFIVMVWYHNNQMAKAAAAYRKKLSDTEAEWKKKLDACVKGRSDDQSKCNTNVAQAAEKNWKEALEALDSKLRELQDGHRATMISDNYNRIMWIAEGVRQARDAVENTMLKRGFKK